METTSSVCPACKLPVSNEFYFCPNCGKQLRPKPIVLSAPKMIGVLLLSFFLPPFGLHPAFSYIKQSNHKTKVVGWTAVVLTLLAYSLAIYSFMNIMQRFSAVYDTLLQ